MKRVVLVTNIPKLYRIPLFNELNRQLNEIGIKLTLIFGSNTYDQQKWAVDLSHCAFEYYVLQSNMVGAKQKKAFYAYSFTGLSRMLKRMDPDLVIASEYTLATVKIWLMSITHRFKYMIWTGNVEGKDRYRSLFRVIQRRVLAQGASSIVVYGSAAKAYVEKLGVSARDVFVGINSVDTSYVAERTELMRGEGKPSDVKYLTYAGCLSRQKGISDLVKTMIYLAQRRDDFIFDVIGEGEELPILKHLVEVNRLKDRIVFHGYKQTEELPTFLARSNGFLFQTGFDIWGLILNEAMAAGVPCIASKNACAVQDLIQNENVGFVVDFNKNEDLAQAVEWLLDNPKAGREIGQRAQQFIADHASLSHSVNGFVSAIQHSLDISRLQMA